MTYYAFILDKKTVSIFYQCRLLQVNNYNIYFPNMENQIKLPVTCSTIALINGGGTAFPI